MALNIYRCLLTLLVTLMLILMAMIHQNGGADYDFRDFNEVSVINHKSDDNVQFMQFLVFRNYSESIKLYFESCNESYNWSTNSRTQLSNRLAHLGEKYFSFEQLQLHKWHSTSADLVILPIFLVLGYRGYCGDINDPNINPQNHTNQLFIFQKYISQFFRELLLLIEENEWYKNKTYFVMGHEWFVCSHRRYFWNEAFTEFASKVKLIIGHYQKRPTCFEIPYTNKVVVTPYTIPFQYSEYQMYDDIMFNLKQFYAKKYSLFFMGSACLPFIHHSYLLRLLAMQYMSAFNRVGQSNKHFGIVTDFKYCQSKDYDPLIRGSDIYIAVCDQNLSVLPCGLTEENAQLNANNRLYHRGLVNSRYNLMIKGDTPTSGRFYDSIAFGVINIFVGVTKENMEQYLPFTDVVPYEKFVFFISPQEFEANGTELIYDILYNTSSRKIFEMIGNLTFYKKYLLWNHKHSLVVDTILSKANSL